MKAFFIQKFGSPENSFNYRELSLPQLKTDEVKIEVEAFGVNYADIMARQGLYGEAPPLPFVPGYEVVGMVVETGENAKSYQGKRVLAFTRFGGYATHTISKLDAISEWETNLSAEDGLALATQYVTAYYATNYIQAIRKDEVVLIQAAAGGVGLALNQICKNQGAITIGLCGSQDKIEFCKSQGFDYVFNYLSEDYIKSIKAVFPNGVDVCYNSLGGKTFKKDKSLLAKTGRIILYGGASRSGMKGGTLASLKMVWQMGFIIPIGFMMGSKSLIGINMLKLADHKPKALKFCLLEVIKLYKTGKIRPVVKSVFKANDIAKAHEIVENRKSIGKVICKF